jgi:uncharacterized membrane protein YoaK (UPF0700 family)
MTTQNPSGSGDVDQTLQVALLLAAVGGFLDAVVYLEHGHVFANAMTGNVVLLGIATMSHDGADALHHIAPLLAFLAGVTASKFVRVRLPRAAHPVALLLEIAALLVVGWLPPNFPQMVFTSMVAFVSALQVASFRHVGVLSYNSTFITGNLRDTAEGLYDGWVRGTLKDDERAAARDKARSMGVICACFLAGAVAGAVAAPRLNNRSFWLAEPLLLVVLGILLQRGCAARA